MAPLYAVSCDTSASGKTLARVHDVIESVSDQGWLSHGPSFWVVGSPYSESEIRDRIQQAAGGADSVLVLRIAEGWASAGLDDELTALLERSVPDPRY